MLKGALEETVSRHKDWWSSGRRAVKLEGVQEDP